MRKVQGPDLGELLPRARLLFRRRPSAGVSAMVTAFGASQVLTAHRPYGANNVDNGSASAGSRRPRAYFFTPHSPAPKRVEERPNGIVWQKLDASGLSLGHKQRREQYRRAHRDE